MSLTKYILWIALILGIASPVWSKSIIGVSKTPQQRMTYGLDLERLWHFGEGENAVDLDELAKLVVTDVNVELLRVAISGAAELEEGQIDWSVYDRQLDIMRAMRRARPGIKFFAIPRPIHNDQKNTPFTPYPMWINIYSNPFGEQEGVPQKFIEFHADKAAAYVARYLYFMREQGFHIDYIYVKTEADRKLRPPDMVSMIDQLRELMGADMPLVVAPASHNMNAGVEWIKEAIALGRTDAWDITSVHNTGSRGSPEEFAALAKTLGKPIWNTEIHGLVGPDDVAAVNSEVIFRHIRAGFDGFVDWLTLGNERKVHKMLRNINGRIEVMRIYYIYKQLVNSTGGGQYLETTIPDGLATTAAFIKNDRLTVWALNASTEPMTDVAVAFEGRTVRPVETMSWSPDDPREGATTPLAEALDLTLKGETLYCFTFALNSP